MKTLITRTITGIIYLILLGLAFFTSKYVLIAVFTVFMLIAIIEYINLTKKNYPTPHTSNLKPHTSNLKPQTSNLKPHTSHLTPQTSHLIFLPVFWIIIPILLLEFWCIKLQSTNIVVALVVILCTNDTLAYVFGSLFGKHKMWTKVSPKKSWEGFLGGLISTLIISWFFIKIPYFQDDIFSTPYLWVGFAFVVIVAGTLGDFAESMLKRLANQKDSGTILPGHGGIFDRIDSLLLAIPAGFIYWLIVKI